MLEWLDQLTRAAGPYATAITAVAAVTHGVAIAGVALAFVSRRAGVALGFARTIGVLSLIAIVMPVMGFFFTRAKTASEIEWARPGDREAIAVAGDAAAWAQLEYGLLAIVVPIAIAVLLFARARKLALRRPSLRAVP